MAIEENRQRRDDDFRSATLPACNAQQSMRVLVTVRLRFGLRFGLRTAVAQRQPSVAPRRAPAGRVLLADAGVAGMGIFTRIVRAHCLPSEDMDTL